MKQQSSPAQPNLRTILIDDEPDARTALRLLLKPHPEIEIVGEATSLDSGEEAIRSLAPDLVFLDVALGGENGFELLERFANPTLSEKPKKAPPEFQVIFCTGSDQHAIRAIRKNALDYLLKPVDPDDLAAAVQKAVSRTENSPLRLTLNSAGNFFLLETADILRIESDGSYTTVHLTDGRKIVQTRSLREFEEILATPHFIRTHQSHLINLDAVASFSPENLTLVLKNGEEIPVARRRRGEVSDSLGI